LILLFTLVLNKRVIQNNHVDWKFCSFLIGEKRMLVGKFHIFSHVSGIVKEYSCGYAY